MELTTLYESLGVSRAVYEYGEMILDGLRPRFEAIDRTAEYNQTKVLAAMQKNKLSAGCFAATTGYGYDDMGREVLEKVYADCFHTEAALVRPQITCGTHALAVALSANLLPGDELLSPNGAPYDTLEEVIGIRPSKCSLMEYGVQYRQVGLLPDGTFDFDGIRAAIGPKTKLITIQRSKGYATRPSFSVAQIGELIAFCKQCRPDVLCMVDNCYGEFVERAEPSDVGADMIVGSLIKNPGGGLAPIGGYISARRNASSAAPTVSRPLASDRRSARISACFPVCTRASSLPRTSFPGRSRARFLPRMCTSGWASASCRTGRNRGTISFRPSSLARRRGCWPSAAAFRRRPRSTAM